VPSLEHLNPPQRAAVLHGGGPLVVFAGAGSGKTRVITHRIAHLLADEGVPPWSILAVTFTNKAAGEMRERLEGLVGADAHRLWVGTFHAICARLLRLHADRIGIRRDFTIYDDADQQAMVRRVIKELGIDDKRHPPKSIAGRINRAKQELERPDALDGTDPASRIAKQAYERYEARMAAASALDFGDLIHRFVLALEADAGLREELARKFRYILVDEFQDTNHAQLRLVEALASVHGNLCVVGDDDQSIYRWRGADRRNILDFRRNFPDATIIKLEQNYRSTQRILRAAHAVIRRNADREPKELWTENQEGPKVLVARTENELDEARMVVRGVTELRVQGHPLSEIAVFYRIHAQSRVLEEALRVANVPYRVVGGMRFYERAEVKDVLAYLRVVHNPADDVSVLRILNVPTRGIGKTTEERLLARAAETGEGVWAAIEAASAGEAALGTAAAKKLGVFRDLVTSLRTMFEEDASVGELALAVLDRTGYAELLRAEDTAESEARLQNLAELLGSLQAFERDRENPTLATFLEEITLDSGAEEDASADRLTLMTVHAAKGLEFRTVMVTGMEEKMFPFRGLEAWDDPEELEEERRLAYVAMTRARERLVLSYAARRTIFGQERVGIPSRFVDELPAEDVQRIGSPAPRPASSGRTYGFGGSPGHHSAPKPQRAPGESYLDRSEGSDLDPASLFRPGMRVRHETFGFGRIRDVVFGTPVRVRVEFESAGTRNVVASFLEPA
jgi:DNA helicase II / ATP-dependent DNA helicase PcrA